KNNFPDYRWTPQSGGMSVPNTTTTALLDQIQRNEHSWFREETIESVRRYSEGKPTNVNHRAYDRSAVARQKCIEHYGYGCTICGFNFESVDTELEFIIDLPV
ncbi:MAG: hypothetical protein VX603_07430, partial [Gemmatimonadota bacterium]|nr:hypothetical protein [Gemmatimonadota bacterium]